MIGWRNIFGSFANKKIIMSRCALITFVSVIALTHVHADNHPHATLDDAQPLSQASVQTPSKLSPDITPTDSMASSDMGMSDQGEIKYDQQSIYIRVNKDLSLWKIANHIASAKGINVNQVMLILLENNPRSFEQNNINSLKAKTVLLFPKKPQFTLSPREAQLEIQRQHAESGNRNSVPEKSEASSDVGEIDAQATEQANKEEHDSNEKVDSVHELHLQSPPTDGRDSQHAQVDALPDWENLPEVSNNEALNVDITDVDMSKVYSSNQQDAFEMSVYKEKLMVIVDRLNGHLEQASANAMLSMIKDQIKHYYDQVTTYDKLATMFDQTEYYYDLIITHYKQELVLFFIIVGVILLGSIIGRDRRSNKFLEGSQDVPLNQQQVYEIDTLPLVEMTGRDQALAQITHNISNQTMTQESSKVADINIRKFDGDTVQEVSPETTQSTTTDSQQQEQQVLTTANSTLTARDLVMAQIASRRQNDAESGISEDGLAQLEFNEVLNTAEIYLAYGQHAKAIACLQAMLRSYPDNTSIKFVLAEAYCLNDQQGDFVSLAEELLQLLPADSLEWKKLQGFAYRVAPLHPTFHSNPDIIKLDAGINSTMDYAEEIESGSRSDKQKQSSVNTASDDEIAFMQGVNNNSKNSRKFKVENKSQNTSHGDFDQDEDFEIEDCATQLDLAKAYVAMGDVEQAQQALNDVINRGDEAQRHQAYQLLVQLASS